MNEFEKGNNMETRNHVFKKLFLLLSLVIFLTTTLAANESKDVAIVLKSKGTVKVKSSTTKKWYTGKRGRRLDSGDVVKTSKNSLAAVMFTDDKTLLKVRENSTLAIKGKREKKSIAKRIFCSVGKFWLKATKQKKQLLVETPSGVAAVKGSAAAFTVTPNETEVIVTEGVFELFNKFGKILVGLGETGKLKRNGKPIKYKSTAQEKQAAKELDEKLPVENELQFRFLDSQKNEKTLIIKYKEKK